MPMQKSCEFDGVADEQLVRLAQRDDREAFSELTRRNYSLSLKMAISILRDRQEAEAEPQTQRKAPIPIPDRQAHWHLEPPLYSL